MRLSLSFGTTLFSVQKFVPDFQIYNLIKFYQCTRLKTFHPFIFPKLFEILIKSTLFKIFSFPIPYWKLTIQGILTRINILYYRNFKILYKSEIQTWEIWIVCPVCICNRFSVLLSAKTFKLVCQNFSIYLPVLLLLSCIKINTLKKTAAFNATALFLKYSCLIFFDMRYITHQPIPHCPLTDCHSDIQPVRPVCSPQ